MAIVAITLPLVVGVMALALDGGVLMNERQHAQTIADAASLAAAYSLYNNYSKYNGVDTGGAAATAARAIATDNGYANDGTTSTVTVNIPPLSGNFTGKAGYAEVIVQYNQPRLFSALWGAGTMSVQARTVARGKTKNNYGVILLDPTMSSALSGVGNALLNVPSSTIAVDSNSPSAARFTGNAGATAQTINITGSYSGGTYVGTVVTGAKATSDPLTGLPVPDSSTMTLQQSSQLTLNSSTTMTINPGVYTGGIKMSSSSSLTMMPGIYYINGGGIDLSGSSSISGSGVMIYNGGSPVGSISLAGSGTVSLTPPTSGTYAGISIFQDRTSTATLSLTGSGTINITGGIYAAAAPLSLTGNGATNVTGSFLIGDSASLTGNGTINVGTNSSGGLRDTRIVE
jgi:hypothetical protein